MDTNKLKKFAQDARTLLMGQVTSKLDLVLSEASAARREFPSAVKELEGEISTTSRQEVIEKAAYTWFNRLSALRFMDANGYTNPRVVTPSDGQTRPEVLAEAAAGHIDEAISESTRANVAAFLNGSKPSRDGQGEAYRLLLVAVCNQWHNVMPFLFEKIADYTELLMPDDLLSQDSILARMRTTMTVEDCVDVEVIGWLYQFYISEKKDQVFAGLKKNVKITAENIPAATQLFTPHWIVRYLVENSLGRLWMLNRPQSKLTAQMDYYIAPEEPETDFLRISKPEEIKICDPACGSGHMLTYAFDLLHAIYEEEGYEPTEIPALILTHNLYGIEIDDRAGALAAFALVMKAAAKLGRRRFLRLNVQPNICVMQNADIRLSVFNDWMYAVGYDLNIDRLASQIKSAPATLQALWRHLSNYLKFAEAVTFSDAPDSYLMRMLDGVADEVDLYDEAVQSPFLLDQFDTVRRDLLKIADSDKNSKERRKIEGDFAKSSQSPATAHKLERLGADYARHGNDTSYRMDLDALSLRLDEAVRAPKELGRLRVLQSELASAMQFHAPLWATVQQFEQAKNFGSLIVPKLRDPAEVARVVRMKDFSGDLLLRDVQERVLKVLEMAEALSPKYHVVVANPPYLGSKGMNGRLQDFSKERFPDSKADLFSMFMERALALSQRHGFMAMINMQSWMFLSAFEKLRSKLLSNATLVSMAHLGERGFDTIAGAVVSTTAFVFLNSYQVNILGEFIRLTVGKSEDEKSEMMRKAISDRKCGLLFRCRSAEFESIPSAPIAYWLSEKVLSGFRESKKIGEFAELKTGIIAGDNDRFIRFWPEISARDFIGSMQKKWYPLLKGGDARKWFGNNTDAVNYGSNGRLISQHPNSMLRNKEFYLRRGLHYNRLSQGNFGARLSDDGHIFEDLSPSIFPNVDLFSMLSYLNSKVFRQFIEVVSSGWKTEIGHVSSVPFKTTEQVCTINGVRCTDISRSDWDAYETSWDFTTLPLLAHEHRAETLAASYATLRAHWQGMTDEMQRLEEENNRIFIDAYGLQDELTPEVPLEEITLTCNPAYRYGGKASTEELETRLRADTMAEFLHYAVGCMFGRYSLDAPGLILTNQGEGLADYLARIPESSFDVDGDNVIPVLDADWFADDITERFRKFLRVTFGEAQFQENLAFIEAALGKDIRKYFTKDFFEAHVRRYKKRPIYWMFSSPKGTFNALIYMHRYRPDTVSVMLNDYLREMITKIIGEKAAQERLADSGDASQAIRTRALKEIEQLGKMIDELQAWERDVVFPLAQAKIEIDLDDGVKVNYPKFGVALKPIKGLEANGDE